MSATSKTAVATEMGVFEFSDNDIVNADEYVPSQHQEGHSTHIRPFLLYDHGFVLAVVFADNEQDALDIAADADALDRFKLDPSDEHVRIAYMVKVKAAPGDNGYFQFENSATGTARTGEIECWDWGENVTFLGNASEPFDIEALGVVELPNPPMSICALYNAWKP